MGSDSGRSTAASTIVAANRTFYDALWQKAHLQRPEVFNTWPLIFQLLPSAPARLEIGPGMRPRLPIAGTHFVDISAPVVQCLNARGGIATLDEVGALAYRDQTFDLVCAFDVIEHVEDDQRVFRELSRVLKNNGILIYSVPLYAERWTEFDEWVGHARRYEPSVLETIMDANKFYLERSAAFGMQPAHPGLVKWSMWWLQHRREWAMFWYNWVAMPLALRFQKRLRLMNGFADAAAVDEVLFVCRRLPRSARELDGV